MMNGIMMHDGIDAATILHDSSCCDADDHVVRYPVSTVSDEV